MAAAEHDTISGELLMFRRGINKSSSLPTILLFNLDPGEDYHGQTLFTFLSATPRYLTFLRLDV